MNTTPEDRDRLNALAAEATPATPYDEIIAVFERNRYSLVAEEEEAYARMRAAQRAYRLAINAYADLIARLVADVEAQAALAEARLEALRDLYKADTGPSFDPLIQARAEARRLLNEADEASDGE